MSIISKEPQMKNEVLDKLKPSVMKTASFTMPGPARIHSPCLTLLVVVICVCGILSTSLSAAPFTPDPAKWYRIVFNHSGQCMRPTNKATGNYIQIEQWTIDNTDPSQLWKFQTGGNPGYWYAVNKNGKALDVYGTAPSSVVGTWDLHTTDNEEFRFEESTVDGYYFMTDLRSVKNASNLTLDCTGSGTGPGAKVITYGKKTTGFQNQIVAFVEAPISFEAENLSRSNSAAGSEISGNDARSSNSAYVQFSGTPAIADWMEFTLTDVPAGTYSILLYYKSNTNRGMCQIRIDGVNQSDVFDEYAAAPQFQVTENLGFKTFGVGNHTLRMTVYGKNPASSGYALTFDKIELLPVAAFPVAAAAGHGISFYLKVDGTLLACGDNESSVLGYGSGNSVEGISIPVPIMSDVRNVVAANNRPLILKTNGTLWACGHNQYGEVGDGTTDMRSIPVQIMSGVQSVAAKGPFTLILKTDGTLWACGRNDHYQLGDGTTNDRPTPVQITAGVQSMAAGEAFSLIVKTDGSLWGCGDNDHGQLGNRTTNVQKELVQLMDGVRSVAAGTDFSLILKIDGSLVACGANDQGQLGDKTTNEQHYPVPIETGVKRIAAGDAFSLILKTNGSLLGCGENGSGELGNGTTDDQPTPIPIETDVQSISAGGNHTLFVKTDGTFWGCGNSGRGVFGPGSFGNITTPVQIALPIADQTVAAGSYHSVMLKASGSLWTCGDNIFGQLGDGTYDHKYTPQLVMSDVRGVAAGTENTFMIQTNGTLWACGNGNVGQLGDGLAGSRYFVPTPELVMAGVRNVSAGPMHTLMLKTDGTLVGCGRNQYSELGDGTTTWRLLPIQIMTGVKSIAAGFSYSLMVKTDGTLWACGLNDHGQLGDGTTTNRSTPKQIMSGVQSVAAGQYRTYILKTDGTVWACGKGGVGDGTTIERHTPVQILTDVISMAVGAEHCLLLKNDGTFWSCGSNNYGQLCDGTLNVSLVPIEIPYHSYAQSAVSKMAAGNFQTIYMETGEVFWVGGNNDRGQLGTGTTGPSVVPPIQIMF